MGIRKKNSKQLSFLVTISGFKFVSPSSLELFSHSQTGVLKPPDRYLSLGCMLSFFVL